MEDSLYCKDLFHPVLRDESRTSNVTNKQWDRMHRKTIVHERWSLGGACTLLHFFI